MKKIFILGLGCLLSSNLLADYSTTLLCFTENLTEDTGSVIFSDSEVYLTRGILPEDYSIKIRSNKGVVSGPTQCHVDPVMGYGTHLSCGDDKVSLDMSNNSGHILRFSHEYKSYGEQKLVCRDKSILE